MRYRAHTAGDGGGGHPCFAWEVLRLVLIGEGIMNFMAMMQKMVQETQGGFGPSKMKKGQLLLAPDSVKYTQEDKTIFSESPSGVKSVDEMTMMGEPTGVFCIACGDGKIYNFQPPGSDKEKGYEQYLIVKARLGK